MAAHRGGTWLDAHDRANKPRHDRSDLGGVDATVRAEGATNPHTGESYFSSVLGRC
jgi:hypothetical protein